MDKTFFEDTFRFDFEANERWCNYLFEQETEHLELNRLMSHLLNAHHLWIRRIRGEEPESGVWDVFDSRYFARLNHQNYSETADFLEKHAESFLVHYTTNDRKHMEIPSEQLLFHILHHSAHHRGQLALLAAQHQLDNRPVHNYVSFAARVKE